MSTSSQPQITSFVIRFIHEGTSESHLNESWRGSIRHVQTEHEVTFTQWEDALKFMQQFLPTNSLIQNHG